LNAFLVSERSNRPMRFRDGTSALPVTIISLSPDLRVPSLYRDVFTSETVQVRDAGIPVHYTDAAVGVGALLQEMSATISGTGVSVHPESVFIENSDLTPARRATIKLECQWILNARKVWVPINIQSEGQQLCGWLNVAEDGVTADLIGLGQASSSAKCVEIVAMHDFTVRSTARMVNENG
jgi:hypothetical protein